MKTSLPTQNFFISVLIILLLNVSCFSTQVYAGSRDNMETFLTEGREFYTTFMRNSTKGVGDNDLFVKLLIASRTNAVVRVQNPNTYWSTTVNVVAGVTSEVLIPNAHAYMENGDKIESKGLRITSDVNISLYATNFTQESFDGAHILPKSALGTGYVIQTYDKDLAATEFAIVATRDNTRITIIPSVATTSYPAGVPYTIYLDMGESYLVRSHEATLDISGTSICADKPVAVFNGNQYVYVPYVPGGSQDHVFEQALPIELWGNEFVISMAKGQSQNRVRVTAFEDNTIVKVNGAVVATLAANTTYEYILNAYSSGTTAYIETSKPAACYQYFSSKMFNMDVTTGLFVGDPSMSLVPAFGHKIKTVTFTTFPITLSDLNGEALKHYINISVPSHAVSMMRLDGVDISSHFSPLPSNPNIHYAQIQISEGVHTLSNAVDGFVAQVYGLNSFASYAYPAGFNILPIISYFEADEIRANEYEYCQYDTVELKSIINSEYEHLEWDFGDGTRPFPRDSITKHQYDEAGEYDLSLYIYRKDVCDNEIIDTINAKITINEVHTDTLPIKKLCLGETFTFKGETFLADTFPLYDIQHITDSAFTHRGCDSVTVQPFIVGKPYYEEFEEYICGSDTPYTFNNFGLQNLTKSGVYIDSMPSYVGCDSVVKLTLHINDSYLFETDTTICQKDLLVWRHISDFYTEGEHVLEDKLTTSNGACDSIYRLNLTVIESYNDTIKTDLCEGEPYTFQTISSIYPVGEHKLIDSLVSSIGCDSFVVHQLNVHPKYFIEDTIVMCDNDTLVWQTYNQKFSAGTHILWDSLQSVHGCDSILKLTLNVNPTHLFEDTLTMCDNEAHIWRGDTIRGYTAGNHIVWDSLVTHFGCDSLYKLNLIVHPTYLFESSQTICDVDSLTWQDTTLVNPPPGEYTLWDSLQTTHLGCDSVYKLNLTVGATYFDTRTAEICSNATYDFNGHILQYDSAGTHIVLDTMQSIHGCDSIEELTITIRQAYLFVQDTSICDNQTLIWRNTNSTFAAGTHTVWDSLITSAYGCDSIYRLNVTVHRTGLTEYTHTMCDNESYQWRGNTYTGLRPGEHIMMDVVSTPQGCDDIHRLTLNVKATYFARRTASICDNETYNFNGHILRYTHGVYIVNDTLSSKYGCDSIEELTLTVHPTYLFERDTTICDNETLVWRNVNKTFSAGQHILWDRLTTNTYGCDSIYKLNVTVNYTPTTDISATICSNEVYVLGSQRLNKPGVYYDTLQSSVACDSLIRLTLLVDPAFAFHHYDTIADSEWCYYRGNRYNIEGSYYDSLTTVDGCDSVYALHLTVGPTYEIVEYATICEYETYYFKHKLLNKSGIYIDSLKTGFGYDSIVHLHLTVHPQTEEIIYDTICIGHEYHNGSVATDQPGNYILDTVVNEYGCNHIRHIHLSEIYPAKVKLTIGDMCADDQYYNIAYEYTGQRPVSYSVKFDDYGHEQGFEDQNDIAIVDSYVRIPIGTNRNNYPEPNIYNVSVYFHNGYCNDSLVRRDLKLTLKYPSWIIEQHWNDAIAVLNDKYNVGYKFTNYQWYHNNKPLIGENESYYYVGPNESLAMGDAYHVCMTREDDDMTICSCPIYPSQVADTIKPDPYMIVVPSYVSKAAPQVRIESLVGGSFKAYNMHGTVVASGDFTPNSNYIINLPRESGLYVFYLISKEKEGDKLINRKESIQKVVVF